MAKYAVYAIYTASMKIGEYEADDEDQALKMSESSDEYAHLCNYCAQTIELNPDAYDYQVVELGPVKSK